MEMTMSEMLRGEDGKEEASPEPYELPPEIIGEILIRLPAKSICRFRCVSKLFRSLSSDQRFAKRHLDLTIRNDSRARKLLVSSNNLYALDLDSIGAEGAQDLIAVELDYPLKDAPNVLIERINRGVANEYERRVMLEHENANSNPRNWVAIMGSFNGLVCICPGEIQGAKFLYNPTTGESKRLPPEPERSNYGSEEKFRTYGFGFDDLNNDYKVVKLLGDTGGVLHTSVYSLKADSWRRISEMSYEYEHVFNFGVNLNGACHWVLRLHREGDNYERVLLAFDIKTEEFREMPLPDIEDEYFLHGVKPLVVGNLKGRLSVVISWMMMKDRHNYIWVMNEYGVASSWSKIPIRLFYWSVKPLCATKNNEEVLLQLDREVMVLYNFETNASRKLEIHGVIRGYRGFEAYTYIESLISPNLYGDDEN